MSERNINTGSLYKEEEDKHVINMNVNEEPTRREYT
jgi:hypothetical protein